MSMMVLHLSILWKSRRGTTFIWINKNAVVSTLFLTCYFVCSCVVFDPLSHLDDHSSLETHFWWRVRNCMGNKMWCTIMIHRQELVYKVQPVMITILLTTIYRNAVRQKCE